MGQARGAVMKTRDRLLVGYLIFIAALVEVILIVFR
jgi:hypothetical protein